VLGVGITVVWPRDTRAARACAEALLAELGYVVGVDEHRVVQRAGFIAAPTAPHFLWHELGHALTYLGDPEPRTPIEGWFPLPAWVEALALPECEADRFADVFAQTLAVRAGVPWAPVQPDPGVVASIPLEVRQRVRARSFPASVAVAAARFTPAPTATHLRRRRR
jgi:hypothetical protein